MFLTASPVHSSQRPRQIHQSLRSLTGFEFVEPVEPLVTKKHNGPAISLKGSTIQIQQFLDANKDRVYRCENSQPTKLEVAIGFHSVGALVQLNSIVRTRMRISISQMCPAIFMRSGNILTASFSLISLDLTRLTRIRHLISSNRTLRTLIGFN